MTKGTVVHFVSADGSIGPAVTLTEDVGQDNYFSVAGGYDADGKMVSVYCMVTETHYGNVFIYENDNNYAN